MLDTLVYNDKGLVVDNVKGNKETERSAYQPDERVKARTAQVMDDFATAHGIMNRSFTEFNDRSVLQVLNDDQKAFNSYIPPRSEDPDESWRAQTVRPITRNKIISIAAHVTASIIYPEVFARNKEDDEDKAAAEVMSDIMEWVMDNSDYSRKFVYAIISAMVNPAIILKAEYVEVMKTVRTKADTGEYTVKEVMDDLLSGFMCSIVPVDEFYITNAYEHDLQRQRAIITRRFLDWADARRVYSKRDNFKYVKPGIRQIFAGSEATFYDQYDRNLEDVLVEEVIYHNRSEDLKLTFLNGVLVDDCDSPNPRTDKMYPFAKSGFEPIDEGRFFYFKSAVSKLSSDQDLVDTLYNMVMDGTFLSLMPPLALYGTEEINSSVVVPGTVTQLRQDTKLEPIKVNSDLRSGLEAIQMAERSMSESSQDSLRSGLSNEGGVQTASEIVTRDKNAEKMLGLFNTMIGFLVEDYGDLVVGDICQHMTVKQAGEISGKGSEEKYMSFLLPNKTVDGRRVTKKIVFDDELPDEMKEMDMMAKSYELLQKEGGMESEKRISVVNPTVFRDLRYKIKVSPDKQNSRSKELEKALNLEAYDRLIQNPVIDQESVTRDFLLDTYKPGKSDKYIKKVDPMMAGMEQMAGQAGGQMPGGQQLKGVNQNLTGQLTGSNNLTNMLNRG